MKESQFQKEVIDDLKARFPGCIVLKNDPSYIQGVPDLTVLHNECWATLEVKNSATASRRPNQAYYVERMNSMSYSNFIYPEAKERVLDEIQQAFEARGCARLPESE